MTSFVTTDQLAYLFTFPFHDPDWKRKLGIGFLLMIAGFLIPIIPWIFLYGYFARLIRQAVEQEGQPSLPEWEDWGDLALDGLRLAVVYLVAMLPFFLLFGCGYLAFFVPALAGAASGGEEGEIALAMVGSSLLGMMVFSFGFLLMLVISFILPPLTAHVVVEKRLGAAFEVSTWWGILRSNLAGFVVSYVLLFGAVYVLAFGIQIVYATLILCFLLPFLIGIFGVYGATFTGALIGQAYLVGKTRLTA